MLQQCIIFGVGMFIGGFLMTMLMSALIVGSRYDK